MSVTCCRSAVTALVLLLAACQTQSPAPDAASTATPVTTGFVAHDVDRGLSHVNVSGGPDKRYIVEANGSGVCVFDFDQDGDQDLYFVDGQTLDGSRRGRSTLYRNRGNGHFDDVTDGSGTGDDGWGFACATADIDRDGLTDLVVTGWQATGLYWNRGDGKFGEGAAAAGLVVDGWGSAATFGDYDKDGLVDLFIARYLKFDPTEPPPGPTVRGYRGMTDIFKGPIGLEPMSDYLFRNRGDGTFEDVSLPSGIRQATAAYGLAAVFVDLNHDGWLDLFVANDSVPNHAHINDRLGHFTDDAFALGLAVGDEGRGQASMGIAVGDVNEDDRDDFLITNFSEDRNTLHLAADRAYDDASLDAGLVKPSWLKLAWGTVFFDFDHDSHLDLFVANGHVYPKIDTVDFGLRYADIDHLFRGDGAGHFALVEASDLGTVAAVSRGASAVDVDGDGDLDLAVARLDERPLLYENRAARGGFVAPLLAGRDCDRDAFGAVVRLRLGERSLRRTVFSGGTYGGSSQTRLHFGVGPLSSAQGSSVALAVTWPCGRRETFQAAIGSFPVLVEGTGTPLP